MMKPPTPLLPGQVWSFSCKLCKSLAYSYGTNIPIWVADHLASVHYSILWASRHITIEREQSTGVNLCRGLIKGDSKPRVLVSAYTSTLGGLN